MKRTVNKRKYCGVLVAIFLLVIGVPLFINACYSCPITILETQWGAAEVLDYYASVLGTIVAVAAILIPVEQFIHEQKNQHETQRLAKIEDAIDQVLDDINPERIRHMMMGISSTDENPAIMALIQAIYMYQLEITVSADRLARSVHCASDNSLKELIKQIQELKKELSRILTDYSNRKLKTVEALRTLSGEDVARKREILGVDLQLETDFGNEQEAIHKQYEALSKQKAELFDKKYEGLSSPFHRR